MSVATTWEEGADIGESWLASEDRESDATRAIDNRVARSRPLTSTWPVLNEVLQSAVDAEHSATSIYEHSRQAELKRIRSFSRLPENWDSYNARRIGPAVRASAEAFVRNVIPTDAPNPAIVPTPSGTISLEWHINGVDLEIEILHAHRASVSFLDLITDDELEFEVSDDFSDLAPLWDRLAN